MPCHISGEILLTVRISHNFSLDDMYVCVSLYQSTKITQIDMYIARDKDAVQNLHTAHFRWVDSCTGPWPRHWSCGFGTVFCRVARRYWTTGIWWCGLSSEFDPNVVHDDFSVPWASYQIRKIAGCACAGNAGNVSPAADFNGNR